MEAQYEATVDLFADLARMILLEPPRIIVELGARDCRETLRFHHLYPDAMIYTFECNPETLPICRQAVAGIHNIMLVEMAVASTDSIVTFYQIDTIQTRTAWADGNPGASSLLKASGKYPEEEYAQVAIDVSATKLSTFMRDHSIPCIDLLWMDLQGGELDALKGMQERIRDVRLIHTEVEFFEIYERQPMFADIKKYLNRHNFYFVGFTHRGGYSGDAVFVNARVAGRGISRHYLADRRMAAWLLWKRITRGRVVRPVLDRLRKWLRGLWGLAVPDLKATDHDED